MDYTKFNVQDFAANESFVDWVNQTDPEAVKYWDLYISTHPEIRATVEKARSLVLNIKAAESVKPDPFTVESIWSKIERATHHDLPVKRKAIRGHRKVWLVPLLVILMGGGGLVLFQYQKNDGTPERSDLIVYEERLDAFVEQVNATDKPLDVHLADGSVITLQPQSRLKYKSNFNEDSTRNIYLLGDAFFDVAPNPYKPFIVHSNEVFVKVLGTSFHVEAPENGRNIVVSVKTGKVSVYAFKSDARHQEKMDGVILLPNQQVNYARQEQLFEKTLAESPEILNHEFSEKDFMFDNAPIAEVFKTLEKAYGIEIVYNEETMKHCFLTAPLGSESLMDKLKIICQTIGASYEVIDANVVISSPGC
jgi:transmembrane sensor